MGIEPRPAHAPAGGVAHVASQVRKQRIAPQGVRIPLSTREAAAAAGFRTELDEVVGGREPADLYAVLRQLAAEEHLVDQRLIDEVPVVRVNLVEVPGAGEEPPSLDREAIVERQRLEVGLLDVDAVVALDRGREVCEK